MIKNPVISFARIVYRKAEAAVVRIVLTYQLEEYGKPEAQERFPYDERVKRAQKPPIDS